jgi:hypothetical protein
MHKMSFLSSIPWEVLWRCGTFLERKVPRRLLPHKPQFINLLTLTNVIILHDSKRKKGRNMMGTKKILKKVIFFCPLSKFTNILQIKNADCD